MRASLKFRRLSGKIALVLFRYYFSHVRAVQRNNRRT